MRPVDGRPPRPAAHRPEDSLSSEPGPSLEPAAHPTVRTTGTEGPRDPRAPGDRTEGTPSSTGTPTDLPTSPASPASPTGPASPASPRARSRALPSQPRPDTPSAAESEVQRLRTNLAPYPFAVQHDGQPLPEQLQLEERYLEAASAANLARQSQLGRPGAAGSAAPGWSELLLASLYEGAAAAQSSASRSPPANAVIAGVRIKGPGQGELRDQLSPILLGSVAAGLGAYLSGVLLVSVDRQARRHQWPQLAPADLAKLLPDPLPVRLTLLPDGRKHYDEPDPIALAELRRAVLDDRERLESWRAALAARGLVGGQIKPLLTAAINVLRRHAVPASHLLNPTPVLFESSLASGSAAFIARTASGLARAWPTTLTDFDGRPRPAWLYRQTTTSVAGAPRAGWSSIGALPSAALAAVQDAVVQLGQALRAGRGRALAGQDLGRHVAGNAIAGISAQGAGLLAASSVWGTTAVPAGEAPASAANLIRQGVASFVNDIVWDSLKPVLGPAGRALAQRLDEVRGVQIGRLDRHIQALTEDLRTAIDARFVAGGTTAGDTEGLPSLRGLGQAEVWTPERIQFAQTELDERIARLRDAASEDGVEPSGEAFPAGAARPEATLAPATQVTEWEDLRELADGLVGLQQALAQRTRMQARGPEPAAPDLQAGLHTQASRQRFPG